MNKQTNTPELRFPEFDGEWEKKKLGEVVNYKNGGSFESLVKNHGVYKLITLKSVNTEGKLCNSGKYIDDKCVETLCNDTLVMILSEQAPGLVGMTAIIPNNNEYVLNQRVAALVPKQFIDSQFLSKLINRNQKYFSVRSAGTKVKNISKGHVENFNFLSPDYTEQQKIGEFFSKLDQQIELEEKKLELLEQQKKGYMQKLFSQDLRFKDENGNEYPNWEEKELQQIIEVRDGTHESPKPTDEGYLLVTSKNLKNNKLDFKESYNISKEDYESINKRSKVEIGDILFGMIGTIGNPILLEEEGFAIKNVALLKTSNLPEKYYILNFLKSIAIAKQFHKMNAGGTQKFISLGTIRDLKINIPSLEEAIKIGNLLKKIDELIKNHSKKIDLLKQRKQGFLQKMFV
ncbi:restriction endonuclease subunit S [Staphylococcus haemolyticus]|uniref:restriction endonuclease subunit S n=1 Tax=Staphylococcus haemolyticus TaxID=1283 RepID=UPI003CFBA8DF